MFDSPDPVPRSGGQFSLPQLARAAVYHAHGLRAEATFEVFATGLPTGVGHGVAAGAWWATERAHTPLGGGSAGFERWAAGRAATLGAPEAATRAILAEPLDAEVEAPAAGMAVPLGAPLLQVTGPLPGLVARQSLFQSAIALGFGAATRARALCAAGDGRPIIDAASVHHPDPTSSTFLAWCGRVGGFSGTTHTWAGWALEVPVVGAPSADAPPTESQDAVVHADDLHGSVAALVARAEGWQLPIARVRLDRPLTDDVDLERHFLLRRALDRHGLRRARICAEVRPLPSAVARIARSHAPIDILLLASPWWETSPVSWQASAGPLVHTSAMGPPSRRAPSARGTGRCQLQRRGDHICVVPWREGGLMRPLYAPGRPLSATPTFLPRRSPLRAPVAPDLKSPPAAEAPTAPEAAAPESAVVAADTTPEPPPAAPPAPQP